jgi:hypothetical protein
MVEVPSKSAIRLQSRTWREHVNIKIMLYEFRSATHRRHSGAYFQKNHVENRIFRPTDFMSSDQVPINDIRESECVRIFACNMRLAIAPSGLSRLDEAVRMQNIELKFVGRRHK